MGRRVRLLAAVALFLSFGFVSARAESTDSDELFEEGASEVAEALPPASALFGSEAHPLIELNAAEFNVTVGNHSALLVEFYAPWCNVCKTVRKEYERAARIAWDLKLPVSVARFNVEKDAENVAFSKDVVGVTTLPTFVLFRGNVEEFDSFPVLTTAEAYVAGLGKLVGSELDLTPAKVFSEESPIDVASWLFWRGTSDGKLQTTLMFYEPPKESMSAKTAEEAALAFAAFDRTAKELMRFSNLRFAICRRPDVLAEFELPADRHSLVLYKEHDEGRVEFLPAAGGWGVSEDGDDDASASRAAATIDAVASELQRWVLTEDTPLVTDIWHKTLQPFRKRVAHLALFFVSGQTFEHFPSLSRVKEGLGNVAFRLLERGLVKKGEFTIAVADGTKYKSWLAAFGLPTPAPSPAAGSVSSAGGIGVFPSVGVEWTTKEKMRALSLPSNFSLEAALLNNPFDRFEALLAAGAGSIEAAASSSGDAATSSLTVEEPTETLKDEESEKAEAAAQAFKEVQWETKLYRLTPEAQQARSRSRSGSRSMAATGEEGQQQGTDGDAAAAVAVEADGSVAAAAPAPAPAAAAAAVPSPSPMPAKFEHKEAEEDKIPWVDVPEQLLLEAFSSYFIALRAEEEQQGGG